MRRLRENTMLETEISKTGEVMVEGHAIGRLDGSGSRPTPRPAARRRKALRAAAQKALAGEIDARADAALRRRPTSNSCSPPTARPLARRAGRQARRRAKTCCKPRVRIIADEQLTGAARDTVQARLDLWLKAHIEKLLGPLFALAAAEDVTGMARGVAFQLVEALGVLERQQVADEVKGLDQAARATLRKYGVRFGAYHIYLPALLKPAPRVLAAQLWALKHGGPETKGLDELAAARGQRPHLDRRPTRTSPRRSTAPSAIASAASARCASTSWSGSPT